MAHLKKILYFSSTNSLKRFITSFLSYSCCFLAKSGTLDFIQKNVLQHWPLLEEKHAKKTCSFEMLQATASPSSACHCVLLIEKLFLLIVCCSANIVVAVAMKSVADAVVVVVKVLPKPSLI